MVSLNKLLERVRPEGVTDFWLSSRKPHKPVSTQTICKWLKKVIVDSGALSGSARDVRSVGSSAAGLDIGKIMLTGDVSEHSSLIILSHCLFLKLDVA